ncbi:MAG: DUF2185 domain-containing protein [Myxococcota bacterium]|nr:DUF2185 domain-containing protein [Myxococcota bacterium]
MRSPLKHGDAGMADWAVQPNEIVQLIPSIGSALVSLSIAKHGEPVGTMERHAPGHEHDSGWVFSALGDTDAYLDNPKNATSLDVNIIANIDASIVPFLTYPQGTIIERSRDDDPLKVVDGPTQPPTVQFMMPCWAMTALNPFWQVELPGHFLRRLENGFGVFWRAGIAVWFRGTDGRFDPAHTLTEIRQSAPIEATHHELQLHPAWGRYTHRLVAEGRACWRSYLVQRANMLICTIYFEGLIHEGAAHQLATTVTPRL